MSSMNFGQDILPKINDTYKIGSNSYKWKIYASDFYSNNGTISGSLTALTSSFTNSISMGRKANTTVGLKSMAIGDTVEASGYASHAEGISTTASGNSCAHAEGYGSIANGDFCAHAEGINTVSSGYCTHSEGIGTIAVGPFSHVIGSYNVEDSYDNWSEWVSGTSYSVGDKVKITTNNVAHGYVCKTANSDTTFTSNKWYGPDSEMNYIHIIGNGMESTSKSNAFAVDWDGNAHLRSNLYVGCNADSTGGSKVATEAFVTARVPAPPASNGTYTLQCTVSSGVATYSWV